MKILITLGGTRESIDGVRFLANFSTGKTGSFIADYLSEAGCEITALCGKGSITPRAKGTTLAFYESVEDLDLLLKKHLGSLDVFDAVIHLAAVSDFKVSEILSTEMIPLDSGKKIPSDQELFLRLTPGPKLLTRLKSYSRNRNMTVVGFKLTSGQSDEERKTAVLRVSQNPAVDYCILNDLAEISDTRHPFTIYKNDQKIQSGQTLADLAHSLYSILEGEIQ